ncbi:MAG: tetratricopeptide repeat protein [Candidatus Omnitrophica bacterium]|nr:tetratricopeptide repeat protein [Candidatus Omnitrophota bacterium]
MVSAVRKILIQTYNLFVFCFLTTALAVPGFALDVSKENLFQLATLAVRDGEYEHAVDFLKKSIEIDPKFVPAYNSLGIVYETSNMADINEAIRYFRLATEIAPDSVESWNNLGRAYYTKGNFGGAEKAFLHSLALKPDQPEVEMSLGWVNLLGQSRGAEAIAHFSKIDVQSANPMIYYGIGLAHLIEGERFQVFDAITELRRRKREDLAVKLEDMLKKKVQLNSQPGTPLVTGIGDMHSVLSDELKAMGKSDGSTEGIQVRLRGPIRN